MTLFNATQRITALYCFLAAQSRPVNATTIRSHVNGYATDETDEAFERKFRRDRTELELLGVSMSEHQGLYELESTCLKSRSLNLDAEEAATLRACGASALSNPSFILHAELLRALNKLADNPKEHVSGIEHIDGFDSKDHEPGARIFSALQHNKTLTFSYTNSRGGFGVRTIDPYTLHCVGGDWYVSGLDHTIVHENIDHVPQVKTFRLDRMNDVRLINPRTITPDFELPPDYHAEEPSFPFDIGPEQLLVTLFFDESIFWKAETLMKGRGTPEMTDRGLLWYLPVADRNRFFEWLALNMPGIKLMAPPELVKEWAIQLTQLASGKGVSHGSSE